MVKHSLQQVKQRFGIIGNTPDKSAFLFFIQQAGNFNHFTRPVFLIL